MFKIKYRFLCIFISFCIFGISFFDSVLPAYALSDKPYKPLDEWTFDDFMYLTYYTICGVGALVSADFGGAAIVGKNLDDYINKNIYIANDDGSKTVNKDLVTQDDNGNVTVKDKMVNDVKDILDQYIYDYGAYLYLKTLTPSDFADQFRKVDSTLYAKYMSVLGNGYAVFSRPSYYMPAYNISYVPDIMDYYFVLYS